MVIKLKAVWAAYCLFSLTFLSFSVVAKEAPNSSTPPNQELSKLTSITIHNRFQTVQAKLLLGYNKETRKITKIIYEDNQPTKTVFDFDQLKKKPRILLKSTDFLPVVQAWMIKGPLFSLQITPLAKADTYRIDLRFIRILGKLGYVWSSRRDYRRLTLVADFRNLDKPIVYYPGYMDQLEHVYLNLTTTRLRLREFKLTLLDSDNTKSIVTLNPFKMPKSNTLMN